jgi:hypothetical protein
LKIPLIYQALLDCKLRLFINQRWIVYSAYLSSKAGLYSPLIYQARWIVKSAYLSSTMDCKVRLLITHGWMV